MIMMQTRRSPAMPGILFALDCCALKSLTGDYVDFGVLLNCFKINYLKLVWEWK
jgi:hypothetical protein